MKKTGWITLSSPKDKAKRRGGTVARFLRDVESGYWWVIASSESAWEWSPVGIAGPIPFQEVHERLPTDYTLDEVDPDSTEGAWLKSRSFREWVV